MLNIHQRMLAVMDDMGAIDKESQMSGGKAGSYKYTSYDALMGVVQPFFVKHGIFMRVDVEEATETVIKKDADEWGTREYRTEVRIVVAFVNVDMPVDAIHVTGHGTGTNGRDVGIGIAVSYAIKKVVLSNLAVPCGEDAEKSMANVEEKMKQQSQEKENEAEKADKKRVYAKIIAKLKANGGTENIVKAWMKEHGYSARKNPVPMEVLESYLKSLDTPEAEPEPEPPADEQPEGLDQGEIEF